jgi:hypothetical protein
MGASYNYGRNGRLNVRWTGWRDEQPDRYPLEVTVTGWRQPPRPSGRACHAGRTSHVA